MKKNIKHPTDGEYVINMEAFSGMKFSYQGLDPSGNLAAQHPVLKIMHSWTSYNDDIPANNLTSYLLFLLSVDSPVNKRYGILLTERKSHALILAGFGHLRKKNGDWNEDVISYLMELRNELVITMIVDYLKLVNIRDWTEMLVLEQELEEANRLRLRPVSSIDDKQTLMAADVKGKLRRESKDIIERIKECSKQFYGGAYHEELSEKVHKMRITVESQASALTNK